MPGNVGGPAIPGITPFSAELALRALGAVDERLRRIVGREVDAPPLRSLDPGASALEAGRAHGRGRGLGGLGHRCVSRCEDPGSIEPRSDDVERLWIPWKPWISPRPPGRRTAWEPAGEAAASPPADTDAELTAPPCRRPDDSSAPAIPGLKRSALAADTTRAWDGLWLSSRALAAMSNVFFRSRVSTTCVVSRSRPSSRSSTLPSRPLPAQEVRR
jgi:hypothetical protein